ncbi:magnesium chelatase domain-containing protein [Candidatus Coxiella mudrowiae]
MRISHSADYCINLAPADLPREGWRFDLAIALEILAASNQFLKIS